METQRGGARWVALPRAALAFQGIRGQTDCDVRIVELIAQKHAFANAENPADYKGGVCED
jgi:hypothetical protein